MRIRQFIHRTGSTFATISAGIEVARALESHQAPAPEALKRLGIAPGAFSRIGH
jgi:hypothetical protein